MFIPLPLAVALLILFNCWIMLPAIYGYSPRLNHFLSVATTIIGAVFVLFIYLGGPHA